ncbi:hypothetical protein SAMN05444172_8471 [Burkholderia sp. GAS332]|nr:hypothetical protein SAMN05444172_8471 [Burkholderia sp. GAS332]
MSRNTAYRQSRVARWTSQTGVSAVLRAAAACSMQTARQRMHTQAVGPGLGVFDRPIRLQLGSLRDQSADDPYWCTLAVACSSLISFVSSRIRFTHVTGMSRGI